MTVIELLIHRFEAAKTSRNEVDPLLQEIGKYVWPAMQDMVTLQEIPNEGMVRTVDVYDTTSIIAAKRMTSGIFSYLMPVGSKWYNYVAEDYEDNQISEYKSWMSMATIEAHKKIWASNYLREMYATIRSLVSFGTGAISYDPKTDFHFYPLQTMYFEEDCNGIVDSVFRILSFNKRQAAQFFENAGKSVTQEPDDSKSVFDYIHCVVPNDDYDGKLGSMKYTSIYILLKDKEEVFEKGRTSRSPGYAQQVYRIPRLPRGPKGIMGESPAKDLLPDIKMLNAMKEAYIKSRETQADPTIVLSDDGVVGQPVTGPGGLVVMRAGAEKPFYLQAGGDPQSAYQDIISLQKDIRDGFYNNVFQALADYRNMTATEVLERKDESMTMLAPEVTPLIKEVLDPLMLSVLDGLSKTKLPPKPAGLKIKINYEGRLALAMSILQASATERTLAKWGPMQDLYPVFDNIDIDRSFRESALNEGVPAELLRDEDERDEQRSQRQQQAALEQQSQVAETASKALKNVSGAMRA